MNRAKSLLYRGAIAIALMAIVFSIAGCTNWEQDTFRTLTATSRMVNKAVAMYNDSTIAQTQVNHDLIDRAQKASNLAAKAFGDYWDLKLQLEEDTKNGSTSQADATAQLNAARDLVTTALRDIPGLVVQLQQLMASGGSK